MTDGSQLERALAMLVQSGRTMHGSSHSAIGRRAPLRPPNLLKRIPENGGRTRTRTWDPLIKSQLLYQLSYAPGAWDRKTSARGRRLAKQTLNVQQGSASFPVLV